MTGGSAQPPCVCTHLQTGGKASGSPGGLPGLRVARHMHGMAG